MSIVGECLKLYYHTIIILLPLFNYSDSFTYANLNKRYIFKHFIIFYRIIHIIV